MSDIIQIAEMRINTQPLEKANQQLERMERLGASAQSAAKSLSDTLSKLSTEAQKVAQKTTAVNNAVKNQEREAAKAAALEESNSRKRQQLIDRFLTSLQRKTAAEKAAAASLDRQRQKAIADAEKQAKAEEAAAARVVAANKRATDSYRSVLAASGADAAPYVAITNAQQKLDAALKAGVITAKTYKETLDAFVDNTLSKVSGKVDTLAGKFNSLERVIANEKTAFATLDNAYKSGAISLERYVDGVRKLGIETKVAAEKAIILGNSADAIVREVNPLQGRIDRLTAAMRELEIRLESGQISGTRYTTAISNIKGEIASLSDQMAREQRYVTQYGTAWGGVFRTINRGLRGQGLQNIGYQVQDIAVQLASGQSAAIALAQQVPQLLMGFGTAGAVIGAVVAVGGALYMLFGSLTEQSKRLEKATEAATSALDKWRQVSELASSPAEKLAEKFAGTSDEIRTLVKDLEDLARRDAFSKIKTQFDEAFGNINVESARQRLKALDAIRGTPGQEDNSANIIKRLTNQFGGVDVARELIGAYDVLRVELEKPINERNLLDVAKSAKTLSAALKSLDDDRFQPFIDSLIKMEEVARRGAVRSLTELTEAASGFDGAIGTATSSAEKYVSAINEMIQANRSAANELRLSQVSAQFAGDPVEQARRVAIERAIQSSGMSTDELLRGYGARDPVALEIMEQALEAGRIAAEGVNLELKKINGASGEVGNAMSSAFEQATSSGISLLEVLKDISGQLLTDEQNLVLERLKTKYKDAPAEAARRVAFQKAIFQSGRTEEELNRLSGQGDIYARGILSAATRSGDIAAERAELAADRKPQRRPRGAARRERNLENITNQAASAKFLREQVEVLGISFEQAEKNIAVYNAQVTQGVTANSNLGKEIDRLVRQKMEDERVIARQKSAYDDIMGPLKDYQEETRALNELLKQGKINQEQYNTAIRKTRLAYLEQQTTIEAGVERTFIKFQESAADFAGQTETLLNTAFNGFGDVIANFARTGKLEFADLVREINAQLLKIAFNEIFTQAMGGPSGGGMFSKIVGGLFNTVTGAVLGGGASGPTLGASSSIKGFASGGSFDVGPDTAIGNISAGADNRLIAFAARDGERVTVETPGNKRSMSQTPVVVNIYTRDAESFKKSQSQVSADIARAVRAGSRNL